MDKRYEKQECEHCHMLVAKTRKKDHEKACYLNPLNIRYCKVCNKIIKASTGGKRGRAQETCGYSCSNILRGRGTVLRNHITNYRTICFKVHGKKCLVCGEEKIVSVHHLDENHSNNDPNNLVPLCPTHHQYLHSRYKGIVLNILRSLGFGL